MSAALVSTSSGARFILPPSADILPTYCLDTSIASFTILAQWELLSPRDYVLALEPTNTHLNGQDFEKANGTLRYIATDEEIHSSLTFTF